MSFLLSCSFHKCQHQNNQNICWAVVKNWKLTFQCKMHFGLGAPTLWSVSCRECGRLLQLSLTCVNMLPYFFTPWECGDEGMTLLNSCQLIKELALFENCGKQTTQLIWVDQLNRFLALHALVEGLGIFGTSKIHPYKWGWRVSLLWHLSTLH